MEHIRVQYDGSKSMLGIAQDLFHTLRAESFRT
jgi:hypothetical protein